MRCVRIISVIGISLLTTSVFAEKPDAPRLTDEGMQVTGNNRFALDLYRKLSEGRGNAFFSPYSITSALAMTYAGARGETASQMERVLHLEFAGERLHAAFGNLTTSLNKAGGEKTFQLTVANALWGQKDYTFLGEFVSLVEDRYGAGLNRVDFTNASEAARSEINGWVEKKTNGKINDLIKPGVLDPLTRLVLTNAIYFKGQWAQAFDPTNTVDKPFTMLDGTKLDVEMMHASKDFRHGEFGDVQVLEMPYVGDRVSMVVLLPKEDDGLPRLEKQLNTKNLDLWLAKLSMRKVDIALPRFTMAHELGLKSTLTAMGMEEAFDSGKADFSGMDGTKDLYIAHVVHKAFIDVNEEGTEAAAATGVVIGLRSVPAPNPSFRADHPFVYIIRDMQTNGILFMGRLTTPEPGAKPTAIQ